MPSTKLVAEHFRLFPRTCVAASTTLTIPHADFVSQALPLVSDLGTLA